MQSKDDDQLYVLVIDDDEDIRRLVTNLLLEEGHFVVPCASAEEGLELLPYYTFQVAFLDHNLPGMEGLVLGEFLLRNNPHMRVALVTGEDDPKLERHTAQLHITFIKKPFELGQLLEVLATYKDASTARRDLAKNRRDRFYLPRIDLYARQLTPYYSMPNVPGRLRDHLVARLKSLFNNLRSPHRYNERDRVAALAGLMTAQVLGIDLPKYHSGGTFFEAYDQLMEDNGRQTAFSKDRDTSAWVAKPPLVSDS